MSASQPNRRRKAWRRWGQNSLLLPPALLFVLVEHVFWAGAKAVLRSISRAQATRVLQERLQKLPAAAVLPLFLVPELFSHLGGFAATVLLVQRKWVAAMIIGILVKGLATLLTVWIYQSCQQALLSVRWFAWLHGKAMRGRDWVAERALPVRRAARRLVTIGRSRMRRRFWVVRQYLAARLGIARK